MAECEVAKREFGKEFNRIYSSISKYLEMVKLIDRFRQPPVVATTGKSKGLPILFPISCCRILLELEFEFEFGVVYRLSISLTRFKFRLVSISGRGVVSKGFSCSNWHCM